MAATLVMDENRAFNHILKSQLLKQMLELGINSDLITWTKLFLTDQKVQLVINSHENKEQKIKIGIL